MDLSKLSERIANGRTDLVTELAASGALSRGHRWPLIEGRPLTHWAAYFGDVSCLRMLLRCGVDLLELGADRGLMGAAFHGHWRLCEYLIEQGADVAHCEPQSGETALHAALTHEDRVRYDRVVTVLLRAGANPNAVTVPGAPTDSLMRDGRTRGETPLHRAAAFGTAATIEMLLHAGARVEQRVDHGDTPLAWASWYRRPVEVLRPLLYGAHRIHPAYRSMRENLLGRPLGS